MSATSFARGPDDAITTGAHIARINPHPTKAIALCRSSRDSQKLAPKQKAESTRIAAATQVRDDLFCENATCIRPQRPIPNRLVSALNEVHALPLIPEARSALAASAASHSSELQIPPAWCGSSTRLSRAVMT
jgi:hypothetical protein